MGDLNLTGPLKLTGSLHLCKGGGTLTVNGIPAMVEEATGTAPTPVMLPPPPAGPVNNSTTVKVISSLGKTIDINDKTMVTMGMVLQGDMWPGMVMPSSNNSGDTAVMANGLPVNVDGDTATIFPNGSSVTLDSGQG